MNKKFKKVGSEISCKATAALNAEVVEELQDQDGDLEQLLEKSRNSHGCRKNSCQCSRNNDTQ